MNTPVVGWHADNHLLGEVYRGTVVEVISWTRLVVEHAGHREEISWRHKTKRWVSKGSTLRNAGYWSLYA